MIKRLVATFICLVFSALYCAPSQARPKQRANTKLVPYDISSVKEHLKVIHDGKGHYLVLIPFSQCSDNKKIPNASKFKFYGDGKKFYRVRVRGSGATCGTKFSFNFIDPRQGFRQGKDVHFNKGEYKVLCGDRKAILQELPAKAAAKIINTAKFYDKLWDRVPHRLARDDDGRYYMVDMRRDKTDHRMWIGVRGNMKLQRMRNIVSDSVGEIYATSKGKLRLVFSKNETTWIQGKQRHSLVNVPVRDNLQMIFNDLGVYDEPLGTPCDDL